jgi:hypothetical protein
LTSLQVGLWLKFKLKSKRFLGHDSSAPPDFDAALTANFPMLPDQKTDPTEETKGDKTE